LHRLSPAQPAQKGHNEPFMLEARGAGIPGTGGHINPCRPRSLCTERAQQSPAASGRQAGQGRKGKPCALGGACAVPLPGDFWAVCHRAIGSGEMKTLC
jgi:hypothetical protein